MIDHRIIAIDEPEGIAEITDEIMTDLMTDGEVMIIIEEITIDTMIDEMTTIDGVATTAIETTGTTLTIEMIEIIMRDPVEEIMIETLERIMKTRILKIEVTPTMNKITQTRFLPRTAKIQML